MVLSTLVVIIHILVCAALIIIILLQAGKGAGMGAAFGGASQTLFGSTGRATFLTKITIVFAVVFGFTSLGLSFLKTQSAGLMDHYEPVEQPTPGPVTPDVPALPPLGGEETPAPGGAGVNLPDFMMEELPGEGGEMTGGPAGGDMPSIPDLGIPPEPAPDASGPAGNMPPPPAEPGPENSGGGGEASPEAAPAPGGEPD